MMPCKNQNKLVVVILLLLFCLVCANNGDKQDEKTFQGVEGKKVAIVVGQRWFKDEELNIPRARFEKEGMIVTIASSKLDTAEGSEGSKVKPDVLIDDLNVSDFDALVFIGGTGVKRDFWNNPKAHAVLREAGEQGKVVAAICWGPVVLANAGILEGKRATGHTAENAHETLKSKGCIYTGESVTVDGNIITAFGPSSADSFAVAIIEALK
jgi:protease I